MEGALLILNPNRPRKAKGYEIFREDERQEHLFKWITEKSEISIGNLKGRYYSLEVDKILEKLRELQYIANGSRPDTVRATELGRQALETYRHSLHRFKNRQ